MTLETPVLYPSQPRAVRLMNTIWFDRKTMRDSLASLEHLESRSEEHTSELQSLMRISYAVFCLKKKKKSTKNNKITYRYDRDRTTDVADTREKKQKNIEQLDQ